jgi:hypothetical protein
MSLIALPELLQTLLPGCKILSVVGEVITIETDATGREIFFAESRLRNLCDGIKYELMCSRKTDQNKLRIKLAKFRGIGGAT